MSSKATIKGLSAAAKALGIVSVPLSVGIGATSLVYGGKKIKRIKDEEKINSSASGYDRHVARNLRSGELINSDLSQLDYGTARDMYKISKQNLAMELTMDKTAFIGTLMNGVFAYGVHTGTEEEKKNLSLKNPLESMQNNKLGRSPSRFGIDKQRGR